MASHKSFFIDKVKKTTTCKFCFFICILDNIFNVLPTSRVLSYENLFYSFSRIYWNLVAKHSIRQTAPSKQHERSKIEIIINEYIDRQNISRAIDFDALRENIRFSLAKDIATACSKHVVGALYTDSEGKLYGFNKATKEVFLHPDAFSFFIRFKQILERLTYFEWLKFMEGVNDGEAMVDAYSKLEVSSKRNNLLPYKQVLFSHCGHHECFYCGKPLNSINAIDLDHFIPWSFSKDDKIWNFVISCKACNSRKKTKYLMKVTFRKN